MNVALLDQPISQRAPENPPTQLHLNPLFIVTQVPPF